MNFEKVCIIPSGVSGSGKSTFSKYLLHLASEDNAVICSADDYFMNDGVYEFNAKYLPRAHNTCFKNAKEAMQNGVPLVIIDNTNTSPKEWGRYVDLAKENGYIVMGTVIQKFSQTKSVHNVPDDVLKKQANRLYENIQLL